MLDRHLRPREQPAFKLPRGLSARMLTYDRFAEERGWHPRIVDDLTADELFWLPVIRAAKADAAEQVAKLQAKDLATGREAMRRLPSGALPTGRGAAQGSTAPAETISSRSRT